MNFWKCHSMVAIKHCDQNSFLLMTSVYLCTVVFSGFVSRYDTQAWLDLLAL